MVREFPITLKTTSGSHTGVAVALGRDGPDVFNRQRESFVEAATSKDE
jgi:hypothetical protein